MNNQGFRVIGFDYPNHGTTIARSFQDLDFTSFSKLTNIAVNILEKAGSPKDRPLFIVGWSLGGLIATRMVQELMPKKLLDRLEGLVLITPGVSVKPIVGDSVLGKISNRTLNHNPLLRERMIKPLYPACLLYTSPSPRDATLSRMPSSA